MLESTSIIINSFHLFERTLFNKGFVVEVGEGVLKERMKTYSGRGGVKAYLYAHSVKNCMIFQTASRVLSNKLLGSC